MERIKRKKERNLKNENDKIKSQSFLDKPEGHGFVQ